MLEYTYRTFIKNPISISRTRATRTRHYLYPPYILHTSRLRLGGAGKSMLPASEPAMTRCQIPLAAPR